MKNKKFKAENCAAVLMLLFIGFCFVSMLFGEVKSLMENHGLISAKSNTTKSEYVDFSVDYPFDDGYKEKEIISGEPLYKEQNADKPVGRRSVIERFKNLITKMKRFEEDCEKKFVLYNRFLELSGYTNRFLGKTDFSETNGIVKLENGQLASIVEYSGDVSSIADEAESLASFSEWLEGRGSHLLYVQIPTKICRYNNEKAVENDHTNEYYDLYLSILEKYGIDYIDIRTLIHNQNIDHSSMFYNNDAHWTLASGAWAAGEIGNEIRSRYSVDVNTSFADLSRYNEIVYQKSFLGYYGRYATLGYAVPDDFSIYAPKFKTDISVIAPDKDLNARGSLESVVYNYSVLDVEDRDYYNNSVYEATGFGNRPLFQTENHNSTNTTRVLFIRNSFSLALIPFFSQMVKNSDWIDLREGQGNFNGSVRSFVRKTNPDVVVILYDIQGYDFN